MEISKELKQDIRDIFAVREQMQQLVEKRDQLIIQAYAHGADNPTMMRATGISRTALWRLRRAKQDSASASAVWDITASNGRRRHAVRQDLLGAELQDALMPEFNALANKGNAAPNFNDETLMTPAQKELKRRIAEFVLRAQVEQGDSISNPDLGVRLTRAKAN